MVSKSRHRQQQPALGKKYPAKAAKGIRIFPVSKPSKYFYLFEIIIFLNLARRLQQVWRKYVNCLPDEGSAKGTTPEENE